MASRVPSHFPFLSLSLPSPLREHPQPLSFSPTSTHQSRPLLPSTQTTKVHQSLKIQRDRLRTRLRCGSPSRKEGELTLSFLFLSLFFPRPSEKLIFSSLPASTDNHLLPIVRFRCLLRSSTAQQLRRTASDGELDARFFLSLSFQN